MFTEDLGPFSDVVSMNEDKMMMLYLSNPLIQYEEISDDVTDNIFYIQAVTEAGQISGDK